MVILKATIPDVGKVKIIQDSKSESPFLLTRKSFTGEYKYYCKTLVQAIDLLSDITKRGWF